MVKVDTSQMDDAVFRQVVVDHLNHFKKDYQELEKTRPSSLRARAFYWIIRVIGWFGMFLCLLTAASFTLVAEEFWMPIWEKVESEYADELARDGVLKVSLQNNMVSSNKNVRTELIREVIVHYNPYWQSAAFYQWAMCGPFIMFYFMSFLSRRIIRRSKHLFKMEMLLFRYFEESRFTKSLEPPS